MPAFIPIRIEESQECKFHAFGPTPERERALFEAGIHGMGIDQLHGHFLGGSDCSETSLIYMVVSGNIWCDSGSEPRMIKAGEMLVAPARGPHWLRLGTSPCKAIWFHLLECPQWDFLLETGHHVQKLIDPLAIERTTESILQASRSYDPYEKKLLFHYSEILLIYLSRELQLLQNPLKRQIQSRLLALWQGVHNDLAYPWSVRELAKLAGFAPGYLHEICRNNCGCTPMQKITRMRMEEARHLLLATTMSLSDISLRVGYKTEYAFSDAFKRIHGIRPGAMRRASGTG